MKIGLILILIGVVIFMGFNISSLRKEAQSSAVLAASLRENNDKLQGELMRLSGINNQNEQFLNELEQNVKALESKMPIETLEKQIPKEIYKDIKPIIDRLQSLRETKENRDVPAEDKLQE
jgi:TolA-binding protein